MNSKIFVYGGGGHGKVVIESIEQQYSPQQIAGVFDDDLQKKGQEFYGHQILGPIKEYTEPIGSIILAIGDNETRKKIAQKIEKLINKFVTIIDPATRVSRSAEIGQGTLLMPGVLVNADAQIGNHCIINSHATIEHDCIIDDFAHIAPGVVLTGAVSVGESSLVGSNSTLVPGIKVGAHCLIAAGSVVTKNMPDYSLVRGNPARIIKIRKKK